VIGRRVSGAIATANRLALLLALETLSGAVYLASLIVAGATRTGGEENLRYQPSSCSHYFF
jgi:hypothetical protein